jgi:hypothetical protein
MQSYKPTKTALARHSFGNLIFPFLVLSIIYPSIVSPITSQMFGFTRFATRLAPRLLPTIRPFRPFSAGVKRVPSLHMQQMSEQFKGKGRLVSITQDKEGTQVDFHDNIKQHRTFGFFIQSLHYERLGLESTTPRVKTFFDSVVKKATEEKVEENKLPIAYNDEIDKIDLALNYGLTEMKNQARLVTYAFDRLAKKMGKDEHCFWDMSLEEMSNMNGNTLQADLSELHKFITEVETLVKECAFAISDFQHAISMFKKCYFHFAPMMMDILNDEERIVALLTINRYPYALDGIRQDLAEIAKLQDVLKTRQFQHDENWKAYYLFEKWANYIDKCKAVKIES